MSVPMRLGRIINPVLVKSGFKLVTANPASGRTFAEDQVLRAITELNEMYNQYVLDRELTIDEESRNLLSISMYTKFGTGLYLIDRLRRSLDLDGDVCEFGVGQGAMSALLAHGIKQTGKKLWLFDIFGRFAEPPGKTVPSRDPGTPGPRAAYQGAISFPDAMVRARLRDTGFPRDRIRIVPGYIEETLNGPVLPRAVCFAFVDVNSYGATLAALRFLDTVLLPGGLILIDDYSSVSGNVKAAIDEFLAAGKERYATDFPMKREGTFCVFCRKN